MSSYQRNDGRRTRRRLALATVVVVLLFFIDLMSGGSLRAAARALGSSLWTLGAAAGNSLFGQGYFSSKRALSAEIESLKRTLAERMAIDGRIEILEQENKELRALSHLAGNEEGITVPIISSTSASPYGTFLIGAGADDGVRTRDAVLAAHERGFVVGLVAEVRSNSALVKELFAPGERIEGAAGGVALSLEGRGGGNARAEVPASLAIAKGDVVTSPQFAGRVIGIIGAVSAKEGSGLMEIFVRTPARTSDLRFVYVVQSFK